MSPDGAQAPSLFMLQAYDAVIDDSQLTVFFFIVVILRQSLIDFFISMYLNSFHQNAQSK